MASREVPFRCVHGLFEMQMGVRCSLEAPNVASRPAFSGRGSDSTHEDVGDARVANAAPASSLVVSAAVHWQVVIGGGGIGECCHHRTSRAAA